eukprot:5558662-Amphidinium_carterae.1
MHSRCHISSTLYTNNQGLDSESGPMNLQPRVPNVHARQEYVRAWKLTKSSIAIVFNVLPDYSLTMCH